MQTPPDRDVEIEGEDIDVVEMSTDGVREAIDKGLILDAKTLVGLMWLRHRLGA